MWGEQAGGNWFTLAYWCPYKQTWYEQDIQGSRSELIDYAMSIVRQRRIPVKVWDENGNLIFG